MKRPKVSLINLANMLTAFRILSVPFLVYLISIDSGPPGLAGDYGKIVAMFLATAAGITDFVDGLVARRLQVETKLGKFLDPVADKLLVCSLFVLFVADGFVAPWILIVMLFREFLILGLRMHMASEGAVLGASNWAKFKTIFQVSAVVAILLVRSLQVLALSGVMTVAWVSMIYYYQVTQALILVSLLFSVVSGAEYFMEHWHVFKRG
ncbi:MAG: CDP-diacylglycerol--glycerol-3-phosphate 3-phosphatidyltransferase [Candidatus Riflebacteria bacterium]|nr:CDP-diacylglycerol--glycerol-3-phosphate 3-phosphatidyltransferase [Candidatus Riflebacteria bacterium]